jgi:fatty acid synthase
LKEFPQLKEENIGNSRDTSFEDMIIERTDEKGVNYVLNSLADEKLQASMRCLAKHGYFVEIGMSDILQNSKLDMKYLSDHKSFKSIFLSDYLKTHHKMPKVDFFSYPFQ